MYHRQMPLRVLRVAVQAEGDYVTLSFSREYVDPALKDETYTTTWFDMFRIVNGKIVEHWGGPHCRRGLGLIEEPTDAPTRAAPPLCHPH